MQIAKREITSLEKNDTYLDMRKSDIKDMIDGNWKLTNQKPENTIMHLEWMKDFYLLKWADFVLFFDNESERQVTIDLLEKNFEPKWNIWSEEKEEWIQSPQVIGPFEYNGKIGLWIDAKNPLNDITSSERGIYRWAIVNPIAYYGTQEKIQDSQKSVWDNVKNIIDNPELNGNS